MNEENTVSAKQMESSTIIREPVGNDQPMFPTWSLVVFLIIVMLILKSFIYIKDPKRHGR